MPPRKSTGSADGDEATHGKQAEVETGANVEDYLLPRSLTQRLAKGVLPPNTAIHKDALLAISKAATVFVSYLSSHANEETQKKTVTPQDVLSALSEIEFDSFRPRIEKELAAYTAAAAQKRKGKKDGKNSAAATKSSQGADPASAAAAGDDAEGSEPDAKRLKLDGMQEGEGAIGKSAMKNGVDDDETELEEEEEHAEEGQEEDVEEQEEDEEEEEEGHADGDAAQLEDELEAEDSDTARRRRNPDMDSDLDSDSD